MSGAYDFLMGIAISDMEEYSHILLKKPVKLPGKPDFESFLVMWERSMRRGMFWGNKISHYFAFIHKIHKPVTHENVLQVV